jgi:hypothetical protein
MGTTDLDGLMNIMQGFRQRKSKDMYIKLRKTLLQRKIELFKHCKDDTERANKLSNLLFCLASNRPNNFGVYKQYAKDEVDELIAHYEDELKDATFLVDGEHLTRLAQALYLLKTKDYENIWTRIEGRANEIKAELEPYHAVNIVRSLTRSQENRGAGKDKTFYNLEPTIVKGMDKLSARDLSHLMYSYGVRNVGNPDLHKLFEKKLG